MKSIRRLLLTYIDGVYLTMTSPLSAASVTLPFDAYGTATAGSTVVCTNIDTGTVLGTTVASGGNWTMSITSEG